MDKKLKRGDFVKILGNKRMLHTFAPESIGQIISPVHGDFCVVEQGDKVQGVFITELEKIEDMARIMMLRAKREELGIKENGFAQLIPEVEGSFSKGDTVKVKANKGKHYFKIGTIGTVKAVVKTGGYIVESTGGACWAVAASDIRLHEARKPKQDETSEESSKTIRPRKKGTGVRNSKSAA